MSNNWFEDFFGTNKDKPKEREKDQDQNEEETAFEKDPDVHEAPPEQKPEFFGFLKDWQNQLFNNGDKTVKEVEEVEKAEEVNFEKDPDVHEPVSPPTENKPDPFGFLKEWQDNLFNNGEEAKPEKKAENPKPRRNEDMIGTWWRRFTLRQFGMGMPSVPPQIFTDLKLMRVKEIHELDEAITDLEKYHQSLQKKTVNIGKRLEQLRNERNRLQTLKDIIERKPESDKPKDDKPKDDKLKSDKPDATPLNKR